MHRHHADRLAALLHVALDRDIGAFEFREKTDERRRAPLLEGESLRKKFLDRIASFRPEATEHRPLAALFAEQSRIEIIGRKRVRAAAPSLQPARDRAVLFVGMFGERSRE